MGYADNTVLIVDNGQDLENLVELVIVRFEIVYYCNWRLNLVASL